MKLARKTIQRLPGMSNEQLLQMFSNAVRIRVDAKLREDKAAARSAIRLIQQEWKQRRSGPANQYYRNATASAGTWPEEGVLSAMSYHVGNARGQRERIRQAILVEVYEGELPPICSEEYMNQWGRIKSPERFNKVTGTLLGLANGESQRGGAHYTRAVCERLSDVFFLSKRYRYPVYLNAEAIFERLGA